MRDYIIRRLLGLIPILIGISLAIFIIMQLIPGDVARKLLRKRKQAGPVSHRCRDRHDTRFLFGNVTEDCGKHIGIIHFCFGFDRHSVF